MLSFSRAARALVRPRGARALSAAGVGGDDYLRVLSERTMIRGFEGPVERLMERVQERVRKQPGLLSFQTIVDAEEPTKFIVLTRWQNQELLDKWIEDPDYVKAVAEMDEYTEGPINYKVMKPPKDELFLL